MTTQEKLVRNKLYLLELAEFLNKGSHACKINGVSRQQFYNIRRAYEEHGLEDPSKTLLQEPFAADVEESVIFMAYDYPSYGQCPWFQRTTQTGGVGFLLAG